MKGILGMSLALFLYCLAGCVQTATYITICPDSREQVWEYICEDGQVYSYIAEVRYDGIEEDDLCDSLQ